MTDQHRRPSSSSAQPGLAVHPPDNPQDGNGNGDGDGEHSIVSALAAASLTTAIPGAPGLPAISSKQSRPKPLQRLSGLPSALKINLRRGSNRSAAPSDISSPPLGLLCVRVIAARNLASKDRNGKSDPFLVIRLGDFRNESSSIKACLHPLWGELEGFSSSSFSPDGTSDKEAYCVAPVWQETLAKTRIEIIAWDKDKLSKNEYLGETSISLEDWIDTAADKLPVPFDDPKNQPVWKRITSSRSRAKVTGEFLIKIGWLALPSRLTTSGNNNRNSKSSPERSLQGNSTVLSANNATQQATTLIEATSLNAYAANNPISSSQEQAIHVALSEAITEYRYNKFGISPEKRQELAHASPLERVKSIASIKQKRNSMAEDMVFNSPPSEGVGTLPIGVQTRGSLSNELTDHGGLYDSDSSSQSDNDEEGEEDEDDEEGEGDDYMSASSEASESLSDIEEYVTAGTEPPRDYFDMALGLSDAPRHKGGRTEVEDGNKAAYTAGNDEYTKSHSLAVPGQEPSTQPSIPGLGSSAKRKLIPGFLRRSNSSKHTVPTTSSNNNHLSPAPQTGSQDVQIGSSSGPPTSGVGLTINTSGTSTPTTYRRKKFTRRKVKVDNNNGIDDSIEVGAVDTSEKKSKKKYRHHRKAKKPKTGRKRQQSQDSPISKDGHNLSTGANEQDYLGIVFVEVKGASNLPRWRNMTRTGWDMDPFCIVSFGHKVFRTKVIRHSRNPVWDERLFFHVKRHEHAFQILFTMFDWDKMSSNDFIGEVPLLLSELAERAPKPDATTGVFKATSDGKIVGDELHDFQLTLGSKSAELEEESKNSAAISIRAKFTPYSALRQRFWRTYLKQYDTDDSETWSWVELYSLLDSLGSTLTRKTISSFFTRFGKTPDDTLTIEEAIICLEDELMKPTSEKRHIDSFNLDDSSKSGFATPNNPDSSSFPPLSLSDNSGGAGMSFTGLPLTGEPADGVEVKDTIATGKDFLTPDAALAGTPNSRNSSGRSNSNASRQSSLAPSTTSTEGGGGNGDEFSHGELEKLINIKTCPLCHKRLSKKAQVDMVSHVAVCASQDWSSLSSLTVDNFVSTSQAHRKWFTKLVNKISNGSYQLGADSANILVQNRMTGQMQEEKMQVYVRVGIRLWYRAVGSSSRMEANRIKKLLRSMTFKQGIKFDAPESAAEIPRFIAFHQLNVDEIRDPIDSFKNFNSFFYRKLTPDARPCADPEDPTTLVSSADCRMTCFQTVNEATSIWIKGRTFSIERLLGEEYKHDAKKFEGGSLCIFRLAPQDYHRYHSPVDGRVGKMSSIPGEYYTVNPVAIRSTLDVYAENARVIVPIDSPAFGRVFNVCIGAMMVGSIKFTKEEGEEVKRAEEYGYFAFGGSTIVLLFEPNTVKFDQDLIDNSRASIETLVRVGMRIGKRI